jgi:ATP-dependent Lon protease
VDDDTLWIDDDTLEESEKEDETVHIQIQIQGLGIGDTESAEEDSDDDFIEMLRSKYVKPEPSLFPAEKKKREKKTPVDTIPIELSRAERKYYQSLDPAKRKDLLSAMKRVSSIMLEDGEVPFKFKILGLPISDHMKSMVLKKIDALADMNMDTGGAYKLRSWVDGFLRIPFGKTVPLPVTMDDGVEKCTDFMVSSRSTMDKHIYGMKSAKTQIMQVLSQWIVNPTSVGNVIALHGPMGTGKTSFARHAIASVLKRPFGFFTLGGASDIANFTGHSYTYEGSTWGRITDTLMQCETMNPVLYFDELDKISATPHGEEIASMLIHLTDRSQNTEFHDRYFAGVDFDMSQCLFVFSFNDIEKVSPILRDRMTVIECGGYNETDKKEILKNYVWPDLLNRLRFSQDDIRFDDDTMRFVISEYSAKEKGVRNLMRTVETIVTRLNMLRVSKHESMKDYMFYMDVSFPMTLTPRIVQTLLKDAPKKEEEGWKFMYT